MCTKERDVHDPESEPVQSDFTLYTNSPSVSPLRIMRYDIPCTFRSVSLIIPYTPRTRTPLSSSVQRTWRGLKYPRLWFFFFLYANCLVRRNLSISESRHATKTSPINSSPPLIVAMWRKSVLQITRLSRLWCAFTAQSRRFTFILTDM